MADVPSDVGFLEWAVGIGASLASLAMAAAFGHAHARINAVETAAEKRMDDGDTKLADRIKELGDQMIDRARVDDQKHLDLVKTMGGLATREDMRSEVDRAIAMITKGAVK